MLHITVFLYLCLTHYMGRRCGQGAVLHPVPLALLPSHVDDYAQTSQRVPAAILFALSNYYSFTWMQTLHPGWEGSTARQARGEPLGQIGALRRPDSTVVQVHTTMTSQVGDEPNKVKSSPSQLEVGCAHKG